MSKSKRIRPLVFLISSLLGIAILFASTVYFLRSHVRAAKSITPGYSPTAVHDLLGEPTATIKSIENLNGLFPATISYRFKTLDGEWIETDTIHFQVADWFAYGSAGYLIVYENGGVARTIWGGT